MTIYYLDPEGGNDANNGTSFALRWKSAAGTGFSAMAPGDTLRVIASEDIADSGITVTWPALTDRLSKFYNATVITAISNTTPIVVTAAGHNLANGDAVKINGSTPMQINGAWTVANVTATTFELSGSTAQGAASGGSCISLEGCYLAGTLPIKEIAFPATGQRHTLAWTGLTANVATGTGNTTCLSGAAGVVVASGFTTGKAAYYTLPSAINLSGFNGVSFLYNSNVAFNLLLCSDTLGATPVHTISVPAQAAGAVIRTFRWDNGGALSTSIASVSISFPTDPGAITVKVANLVAVKGVADTAFIAHDTLLSNGQAGGLYTISSIREDKVYLGTYSDNGAGICGHYVENFSGSAALYTMTPIVCDNAWNSAGLTWSAMAGTPSSPFKVLGGWNRTDMSTKTGQSVIYTRHCNNSNTKFQFGSSTTYCEVEDIIYLCNKEMALSGSNIKAKLSNIIAANLGNAVTLGGGSSSLEADFAFAFSSICVALQGSNNYFGPYLNAKAILSGSVGLSMALGGNNSINNIRFVNNDIGISLSGDLYAVDCEFSRNTLAIDHTDFSTAEFYGGSLSTISGATALKIKGVLSFTNTTMNLFGSEILNTTNNTGEFKYTAINAVDANTGSIGIGFSKQASTSVRHTASGLGWLLTSTSASRFHEKVPILFNVANVAVSSVGLVTAKVWVYRSDASITAKFGVLANAVSGGSPAAVSSITTAAWEELTLTFTPTTYGVIPFYIKAYGANGASVAIDDFSITQG